jgi:hypothetical protein
VAVEAGGLERLLGIEIGPDPDRLAVLDVGQVSERRLGLGSAALAPDSQPADRQYPIAEVADPRILEMGPVDHGMEVPQPLARTPVAPVDGGLPEQERQSGAPFDGRVEELEHALDVAPVEGVDEAANDVDVVPGHWQVIRALAADRSNTVGGAVSSTRLSLGAAIALGAVAGLVVGVLVSIATDLPLAPEIGLIVGGAIGWIWRRGAGDA